MQRIVCHSLTFFYIVTLVVLFPLLYTASQLTLISTLTLTLIIHSCIRLQSFEFLLAGQVFCAPLVFQLRQSWITSSVHWREISTLEVFWNDFSSHNQKVVPVSQSQLHLLQSLISEVILKQSNEFSRKWMCEYFSTSHHLKKSLSTSERSRSSRTES